MNVKGANESNDTTVTTENDCTDVHDATGKHFMQLLSFLSNLIDIHGLCLYSYFVTVYTNTCSISDTNVLQSSVNTTGDEHLQDSSTWNSPSQQLETTTAMRALTNDRFLGEQSLSDSRVGINADHHARKKNESVLQDSSTVNGL